MKDLLISFKIPKFLVTCLFIWIPKSRATENSGMEFGLQNGRYMVPRQARRGCMCVSASLGCSISVHLFFVGRGFKIPGLGFMAIGLPTGTIPHWAGHQRLLQSEHSCAALPAMWTNRGQRVPVANGFKCERKSAGNPVGPFPPE